MRRSLVYFLYDPAGRVDDYVIDVLEGLRPWCEHVLVVVNGQVLDAGRAALEQVADVVVCRENRGFDVGAYRAALGYLRRHGRDDADELILANYTFFAPLARWGELFERTDAWTDVDAWGLTGHRSVSPHPFLPRATMPAHLSSHWIAVRRRLWRSRDFTEYWAHMPQVTSYEESIQWHETRFTEYVTERGYTVRCAFPWEDYDVDNAAVQAPAALLADGCPILKRRVFFHDPRLLARHGEGAARALELLERHGGDVDPVLSSSARSASTRTLISAAGLTRLVPGGDVLDVGAETVVMVPEDRDLEVLPAGWRRSGVRAGWSVYSMRDEAAGSSRRSDDGAGVSRVLEAWSEQFQALADADPHAPVVVVARAGVEECRDGALSSVLSQEALAEVAGLLSAREHLGAVVPVVDFWGTQVLGRGWAGRRAELAQVADAVGLHVPLDEWTPVAPYGGVMAMRACAAAHAAQVCAQVAESAQRDVVGLDALLTSIVAERGWYTVQVATRTQAQVAVGRLELCYQGLAAHLPADLGVQESELAARARGIGGAGALLRSAVRRRAPYLARALTPAYRRVRALVPR